jgi:hypothetical protein
MNIAIPIHGPIPTVYENTCSKTTPTTNENNRALNQFLPN